MFPEKAQAMIAKIMLIIFVTFAVCLVGVRVAIPSAEYDISLSRKTFEAENKKIIGD